ncbi:TonB-dependent receptor domain-containing protein [Planctobacterium marinum]|uniref:TonB-dependent receptor n=1 Tax=Planctobacterium marinum TaxID=1631968 RepID=A0AA48HTG5_9ALTE|nr:hypothetical protein MACH26_39180 [Planctobacterium marinum]
MKKFALSRLNTAITRGLCYGSVAASLAIAPQAFAQEEETTDETASVERVMVTGSRIARDPNLAASSPIQAIEAEAIRQSGEFSITDIVNDVPALFSSTGSENSKDTTGFADGTNTLNLRGLGSNRTLVLVNGRRHVAGVEGTGAVDVGSIPMRLIKSVEVLTGGSSAIYGADAVTGVVNFILNDEFEGFEFDAQQGVSSEGDAQQTQLAATYGFNFDNDKGNLAISVEYAKDEGLRAGERDNGLWIGSGDDGANPLLRFQQGDINGSTPNFAAFFSPANDLVPFGLNIPSMEDFIADYTATYGVAPNLTSAEMALFNQAANAFPRAVLPGFNFGITSGTGMIIAGNPYTFDGFDPGVNIDLDRNGVPDCYDSFTGYNSSFGSQAFGVIGGCWFAENDGSYRPVRDGLISSTLNSFGGDGSTAITNPQDYILIPEEKVSVNLIGHYDVTDDMRLTAELKYAYQEVEDVTPPTSFWDLLFGAPDNPYLPEFIRPVAQQTGGVAITVDPVWIGDGHQVNERETVRAVLGLNGFLDNGWSYDLSLVWGKFEREMTLEDNVIVDRFFAAIDAVGDGNGGVTCRAEVDPNTPLITTPFELPAFDPGYYTFTPGAGSCVPLNIWAGASGVTQTALDWVTTDTKDSIELEQTVLTASLAGDLDDWFELPAGSIAFALGAEYREEKSEAIFDAWQTGVLPAGSPFGEGTNIIDVSGNASTIFDPAIPIRSETGEYDVTEAFVELQIPLLEGVTMAEELTLELAARFSDYSSIGDTSTWKANVMWSPVEDVRVRTSLSQAVRAPNITELFGPTTGTTISKDDDICDVSAANTSNIQNNCETQLLALGVDAADIRDANGNYIWVNPLTARFSGTTSGNRNLTEETADTLTVGFVYTPEWLDGFDLSVDYWSIEIEDAINEVDPEIIIESCYAGAQLNNLFCDLFTRNSASQNAAAAGGLNFLANQPVNFAKRETSGYDFSVGYRFSLDEHEFAVKFAGTKVNELNDFTNPLDLTEVDPELHEVNRPEWAGNFYVDYQVGDLTVSWQTQYMDEQGLTGIEIEDIYGYGCEVTNSCTFGPSVIQEESFIHDISGTFQINDEFMVYGGIKNITEEDPFITDFAFPASPRGRFFYFGVNFRMD